MVIRNMLTNYSLRLVLEPVPRGVLAGRVVSQKISLLSSKGTQLLRGRS